MATCPSQGLRGELVSCAREVLSVGRDPMHFLGCCLQGLSFGGSGAGAGAGAVWECSQQSGGGARFKNSQKPHCFLLYKFCAEVCLQMQLAKKKSALEQDRVAN